MITVIITKMKYLLRIAAAAAAGVAGMPESLPDRSPKRKQPLLRFDESFPGPVKEIAQQPLKEIEQEEDDSGQPYCAICFQAGVSLERERDPLQTKDCACRNDGKPEYIHYSCLVRWLDSSDEDFDRETLTCYRCKEPYRVLHERSEGTLMKIWRMEVLRLANELAEMTETQQSVLSQEKVGKQLRDLVEFAAHAVFVFLTEAENRYSDDSRRRRRPDEYYPRDFIVTGFGAGPDPLKNATSIHLQEDAIRIGLRIFRISQDVASVLKTVNLDESVEIFNQVNRGCGMVLSALNFLRDEFYAKSGNEVFFVLSFDQNLLDWILRTQARTLVSLSQISLVSDRIPDEFESAAPDMQLLLDALKIVKVAGSRERHYRFPTRQFPPVNWYEELAHVRYHLAEAYRRLGDKESLERSKTLLLNVLHMRCEMLVEFRDSRRCQTIISRFGEDDRAFIIRKLSLLRTWVQNFGSPKVQLLLDLTSTLWALAQQLDSDLRLKEQILDVALRLRQAVDETNREMALRIESDHSLTARKLQLARAETLIKLEDDCSSEIALKVLGSVLKRDEKQFGLQSLEVAETCWQMQRAYARLLQYYRDEESGNLFYVRGGGSRLASGSLDDSNSWRGV